MALYYRSHMRDLLSELDDLNTLKRLFGQYFSSGLQYKFQAFEDKISYNLYKIKELDNLLLIHELVTLTVNELSIIDLRKKKESTGYKLKWISIKDRDNVNQKVYLPSTLIKIYKHLNFILSEVDESRLIILRIDSLLDLYEDDLYPRFQKDQNMIIKNNTNSKRKTKYLLQLKSLIEKRSGPEFNLNQVSSIYRNFKNGHTKADYDDYNRFLKELTELVSDLEVNYMLESSHRSFSEKLIATFKLLKLV